MLGPLSAGLSGHCCFSPSSSGAEKCVHHQVRPPDPLAAALKYRQQQPFTSKLMSAEGKTLRATEGG